MKTVIKYQKTSQGKFLEMSQRVQRQKIKARDEGAMEESMTSLTSVKWK